MLEYSILLGGVYVQLCFITSFTTCCWRCASRVFSLMILVRSCLLLLLLEVLNLKLFKMFLSHFCRFVEPYRNSTDSLLFKKKINNFSKQRLKGACESSFTKIICHKLAFERSFVGRIIHIILLNFQNIKI